MLALLSVYVIRYFNMLAFCTVISLKFMFDILCDESNMYEYFVANEKNR